MRKVFGAIICMVGVSNVARGIIGWESSVNHAASSITLGGVLILVGVLLMISSFRKDKKRYGYSTKK